MRVAVINETSQASKNQDILRALEGRGLEIINAGMKSNDDPELTFIDTALMSALLLNMKAVDLVIGGCGTGQGYLNAVLQYPGVAVGHILNPLDAWMFIQINAGNCISLALAEGYGWGGDQNLVLTFDQLFRMDLWEHGYPDHRRESEKLTRKQVSQLSEMNHYPITDIVDKLWENQREMLRNVLCFPGFMALVEKNAQNNQALAQKLQEKFAAV